MSNRSVWLKLKRAYDANRGANLTADDVTCLVAMDTAVMDLTHPEREGVLPTTPPKIRGHLYRVESGGWFICRALNARKARSVGVAELGRGRTIRVSRATEDDIAEYLRWRDFPKDHVFELEEPTS